MLLALPLLAKINLPKGLIASLWLGHGAESLLISFGNIGAKLFVIYRVSYSLFLKYLSNPTVVYIIIPVINTHIQSNISIGLV
jgi:hypothetical protein